MLIKLPLQSERTELTVHFLIDKQTIYIEFESSDMVAKIMTNSSFKTKLFNVESKYKLI